MHPIIANARAIRAKFFPPPPPVRVPARPAPAPEPVPAPAPARPRFECLEEKSIALILRLCAAEYGLTVEQMRTDCRKHDFVRARRMACAMLRLHKGLSYPRIGTLVGVDHTSAYLAVRRWDQIHGTSIAGREARS